MPLNRTAYSCIRCSDRKVKCDRQDPCSACVKHNVTCSFRPVRQSQRKQKRLKREFLIERLQHCQALLQAQGLDINEATITGDTNAHVSYQGKSLEEDRDTHAPTPASAVSDQSRSLFDRGRAKFVENSLMSRVAEELHRTEQTLRESSQEGSDGEEEEESEYGLNLFAQTSPRHHGPCIHPHTDQILRLWRIFTQNVDPVTKIVHVPSLEKAVRGATGNIEVVPRAFNALLFAIYSTAILSLDDDQCQEQFGQSRDSLLSRYIESTKMALTKADYTSTTSLIVLQALIFHMLCIRQTCNPRSLWVLTGVAMRIAQGIGLHRDAGALGLTPFEAEIRCRVWYYLKMHDERAAELCGQPRFQTLDIDMNVARALVNTNDEDLHPNMPIPPTESSKPTDVIFLAVKTEFFTFAGRMAAINRKHGALSFDADDYASKRTTMPDSKAIQNLEEYIETKYIRYCDPSNPLQFMSILFTRFALNVSRFMSRHPRKWDSRELIPEPEREYLWTISLNILEQLNVLQSDHSLRGFAWNSATYLQWHAFIHVLDSLRADQHLPDTPKAWQLVRATFENNPTIITNTKRPLHIAIRKLCLKAFDAHEAGVAARKLPTHQIPDYIQMLRQREELAGTQVQDKPLGEKQSKAHSNRAHHTDASFDTPAETSRNYTGSDLRRETASQASAQRQTSSLLDSNDSSFWLTNDFNMTSFNTVTGIPELLPDDVSMQAIDWTQWDAWLSGTNFMGVDASWEDGWNPS